ncbi:Hypothetical_protein [Hexamita inflata]|uniref:Hypothetical_protein n=1 Tax=Hexamita inflata TaxID=28002 RepID=A0AA86QIB5_9EUKA|nr:Hypothetical protein HINF_LOCUS44442 [Hexamita inflata]
MKREASAWEQVMLNQKCIMHTLVQISDIDSFQQHLNKFQSFYYSYDEQNKQLVLNDSIQYVVSHSDLQFNDFVAQFSQQDFRPLSSLTVLPSGLVFSIALYLLQIHLFLMKLLFRILVCVCPLHLCFRTRQKIVLSFYRPR